MDSKFKYKFLMFVFSFLIITGMIIGSVIYKHELDQKKESVCSKKVEELVDKKWKSCSSFFVKYYYEKLYSCLNKNAVSEKDAELYLNCDATFIVKGVSNKEAVNKCMIPLSSLRSVDFDYNVCIGKGKEIAKLQRDGKCYGEDFVGKVKGQKCGKVKYYFDSLNDHLKNCDDIAEEIKLYEFDKCVNN